MKTIAWNNIYAPARRLDVRCPSAPWEGTTIDSPDAYQLAISLSIEYGYARIFEDGRIIAEYTDGYAS